MKYWSLLLMLCISRTYAQQNPATFVCHYYGNSSQVDEICRNMQRYISAGRAEKEVKKIASLMNLSHCPFQMVECDNTDNCFATLVEGVPTIIYDRDFLNRVEEVTTKDWAAISILAHEVGHLAYYHPTSPRTDQRQKELEADEFSGACLFKLGASLEEAQLAINHFQDETGNNTHPPRWERLKAIEKGWKEEWTKAGGKMVENKNEEAQISIADETQKEIMQPVYTRPQVVDNHQTGCIEGNCSEGLGYFIHSSQGSYKGLWKDGKRHGAGIHYDPQGYKIYEGDWIAGKRDGNGIYYFETGEVFQGIFINDRPSSSGEYVLNNATSTEIVKLRYVHADGTEEIIRVKKGN